MIKHIFILLWNSRRKFTGIIIEQCLVFIVLILCMTSVFEAGEYYNQPGLLDTNNVAMLGFMTGQNINQDLNKRKEVNQAVGIVVDKMRKWDYVETISESAGLVPYLRDTKYYWSDSIKILNKRHKVHIKWADIAAKDVFNIEIEAGEWLSEDLLSAVVSRQFLREIGEGDLIGTQITDNKNISYTITGITSGIKEAVFEDPLPVVVFKTKKNEYDDFKIYREICAKLKPGHMDEFLNSAYNEYKQTVPYFEDIEFTLKDMGNLKDKAMFPITSKLKLFSIPTVFLILFAFIGTFGLFMLNVKKREQEFGLRIALGSTRNKLLLLMIYQSIFITFIASIPGLLLSLFIFDITISNVLAILTSLLILLLFSLFSAWYPSWKISRINPSAVLYHE